MAKNMYANDLLMEAGKLAEIPVHEEHVRSSCWSHDVSRMNVAGSTGYKYLRMIADKEFAARSEKAFSDEPRLPW